jgi:hypothetical protein
MAYQMLACFFLIFLEKFGSNKILTLQITRKRENYFAKNTYFIFIIFNFFSQISINHRFFCYFLYLKLLLCPMRVRYFFCFAVDLSRFLTSTASSLKGHSAYSLFPIIPERLLIHLFPF